MFQNQLIIAGRLTESPVRKVSPAGIPHCYFVIEHSSEQIEADMPRKVRCRIKVIASGQAIQLQTQILQSGHLVKVTGFIQRQESANGLAQLVLHAQMIEKLD